MIYEITDAINDFFGNAWDALGDILPSDTPTLTVVALLMASAVVGICWTL